MSSLAVRHYFDSSHACLWIAESVCFEHFHFPQEMGSFPLFFLEWFQCLSLKNSKKSAVFVGSSLQIDLWEKVQSQSRVWSLRAPTLLPLFILTLFFPRDLSLSPPSQLSVPPHVTKTRWVGVLASGKVHLWDGWVGGQKYGKESLA